MLNNKKHFVNLSQDKFLCNTMVIAIEVAVFVEGKLKHMEQTQHIQKQLDFAQTILQHQSNLHSSLHLLPNLHYHPSKGCKEVWPGSTFGAVVVVVAHSRVLQCCHSKHIC